MQNNNINDDNDSISSISDINVTPFIDVMLVLLIIFMVTAPLMVGGVKINLPKTTGLPMERLDKPLIVSLDKDNNIFVDKDPIAESQKNATFKRLALESETGEIYVRGDSEVLYGRVMELMSDLGQAGFARVTLVSNVLPNSDANLASEPEATGDTLGPSTPSSSGSAPDDAGAPPSSASPESF